jgi:hypothetical protein
VVEDTADAAPSGNYAQTWRPRHLGRIYLTQPDLSRQRSSAPSRPEKLGNTRREVIDVMLAKYPTYGNRYTLFAAASTQFPS